MCECVCVCVGGGGGGSVVSKRSGTAVSSVHVKRSHIMPVE